VPPDRLGRVHRRGRSCAQQEFRPPLDKTPGSRADPFVASSSTPAEALTPGWRRPLPVLVRINDRPEVPWRIDLMLAGNGDFCLYLHEIARKASGTFVGDRVAVEL